MYAHMGVAVAVTQVSRVRRRNTPLRMHFVPWETRVLVVDVNQKFLASFFEPSSFRSSTNCNLLRLASETLLCGHISVMQRAIHPVGWTAQLARSAGGEARVPWAAHAESFDIICAADH
jgi:hypothetical protein